MNPFYNISSGYFAQNISNGPMDPPRNRVEIFKQQTKAPEFCAYCGAVMPPSDKCENCGAPK